MAGRRSCGADLCAQVTAKAREFYSSVFGWTIPLGAENRWVFVNGAKWPVVAHGTGTDTAEELGGPTWPRRCWHHFDGQADTLAGSTG